MNDTNLLADLKLNFNIKNPSIEECYLFGYECSLQELEETENPYKEGTTEHSHWQEGWWDAFYGEKPLFDYDLPEQSVKDVTTAANDTIYHEAPIGFWGKWLKISGALAASAVVGYQVVDLVA